MLITLDFFSGLYRLANHNLDPTAIFIDELKLSGFSVKRGLATDSASVELSKLVLDSVATSLIYLVPNIPVRIDFYDNDSANFKYGIDGYISKTTSSTADNVRLQIDSKVAYHMSQSFVPQVAATCQNQVYSKMCGLDKALFVAQDTSVTIDCLTGVMDYTPALEAVHGSIMNVQLAHVVLDGNFKTRVTGVDRVNKKIYLALTFASKIVTVDVGIYLYCNKSYGQCYSRFSNVKNFYGFAGQGQSVRNFDVFSATGLDYCGEDAATLPQDTCSTDTNIFGIKL